METLQLKRVMLLSKHNRNRIEEDEPLPADYLIQQFSHRLKYGPINNPQGKNPKIVPVSQTAYAFLDSVFVPSIKKHTRIDKQHNEYSSQYDHNRDGALITLRLVYGPLAGSIIQAMRQGKHVVLRLQLNDARYYTFIKSECQRLSNRLTLHFSFPIQLELVDEKHALF